MALNVGLCYIDLGNYKEAKKYYEKALALSAQLSARDQANTLNHLGFLALKQLQAFEAKNYFIMSQQKFVDVQDEFVKIETLRGLSIAYEKLGDSKKSNDLINQVLVQIKDYKNKVELYECQARNFEKLKQFDSACISYKNVAIYRDSLMNQNDKELAETVLAKYSVDKAEDIAKLAVLEKENANLNAAKQKRMKQFGFLLFGLSLALLLSSVYAYLKNKKAKNQIAHQNELLNHLVDEKEMLMREIHHRVKNNLQVMSGLLQLQSNASQNTDLKNSLVQSQKRISSIAAIHELLYSNNQVNQVNMQTYFEKITEQTIQIHDEGIIYEIQTNSLKLEMDKAIPLGLILNEWITNSFKHAFKPPHKGHISVQLIKVNNSDFSYQFIYRDNGKMKFSNKEEQHTLGLRIINMMAEQIHGELHFEYNNGANYELYF